MAAKDLAKENLELKEQIQLLQMENQRLKIERVVKVIKQKEVRPPGYEADMKRLKMLERENQRFRRLLEYGNISVLEGLIADYKAASKPRLDKIVQEYQFCYADHQERMIVKEFIEYLQSVEKQLQEYLFLDEAGDYDE